MPSPYLIVTVAVALGVGIDTLVKAIALDLSVLTVTTWRFVFGSGFALTLFIVRKRPMPRLDAIRFHVLRGVVQLITALSFFWALTQIALAEATVMGFMAALMVPAMGRLILKEKISPVATAAALAGFCGAAFALSAQATGGPEGNRVAGALAAFTAAVGYALTLVLIRLRTRKEDTDTIAMFGNVMPAALLLLLMLVLNVTSPNAPPVFPKVTNLLPLFALGGVAFCVWWLMSEAYRHAEAQRLAPFEYLALPMSVTAGFFVFGEVPSWRLYVGAMIIIAGCLAIAFEDRLPFKRFRTD
ncbi:MAG: DMT family transporter [Pseudomonadota bacterium]